MGTDEKDTIPNESSQDQRVRKGLKLKGSDWWSLEALERPQTAVCQTPLSGVGNLAERSHELLYPTAREILDNALPVLRARVQQDPLGDHLDLTEGTTIRTLLELVAIMIEEALSEQCARVGALPVCAGGPSKKGAP